MDLDSFLQSTYPLNESSFLKIIMQLIILYDIRKLCQKFYLVQLFNDKQE